MIFCDNAVNNLRSWEKNKIQFQGKKEEIIWLTRDRLGLP